MKTIENSYVVMFQLFTFTAVSSFIGAVYGRIIGRAIVDLTGGIPSDEHWKWIDPGIMAVLGAASFFTGVARLTVAMAVIVVIIWLPLLDSILHVS